MSGGSSAGKTHPSAVTDDVRSGRFLQRYLSDESFVTTQTFKLFTFQWNSLFQKIPDALAHAVDK